MTQSSHRSGISPKLLLMLFVLGAWSWTLLFPALNWPDELYKISLVGIEEGPYFGLLSRLSDGYCIVSYVYAADISYLSNSFHIRMTSDGGCYYTLKAVNTALLCILAAFGAFCFKNKDRRTVFLLSLIWPAQLFYSTSINQQTAFCVLSILIMTWALGSRRILPCIALSLSLIVIDRSFLSLSVFLCILLLLRWRPKLAPLALVVVVLLIVVARPYIADVNLFVSEGKTIRDVSESLSDYYDSPIISLGLLFVSFVYLGGTNSILGIGLDYILVFTVLLYWLWQARGNRELRISLYAFALTYFTILSFVPTIQTFRYYVFILPVLIHFLVQSPSRRRNYVVYCSTMTVVYLLQAAIIHG